MILRRFPEEYAQLHPIVPFVVGDVRTGTNVCIALKGDLASKMPTHWKYGPASPLFTAKEHDALRGMVTVVLSHLDILQVKPSLEFESQERIDDVGSFYYFR